MSIDGILTGNIGWKRNDLGVADIMNCSMYRGVSLPGNVVCVGV